MPDLGKAYVQIIPSAKGIKGSIEQAIGGEAQSAGVSAGGGIAAGIKGAIVKAGIGIAVGKVVQGALDEGGKLQQSIGGIQTLFGNQGLTIEQYAASQQKSIAEVSAEFGRNTVAEAKMMENAAKAYQTAGLSRNEYMEQATSFSATLLQGLEGDTVKAAEYADKAMIDMSDNANKFGTDISSIQNAYQGFAKNNYTMLDNLKLGYGGTAAEMARLLNDSGVLGDEMEATAKNVKDIPFDKVIEGIHVIQDNLRITDTTAEEASKTFSGSMQAMAAAGKNVLASLALGEDLQEPLNALIESFSTFFTNNLLPMLGNVLKAIPGAVTSLFQNLSQNAGQISTTVIDMITGFATAVFENLPMIMESIFALLQAITEAFLTYDWATTGADMLTRITEGITTGLPRMLNMGMLVLQNLVQGLMQAIPALMQAIPQILAAFGQAMTESGPTLMLQGVEMLRNIITGIVDNLPMAVQAMTQLVTIQIQTLTENLPEFIQAAIEIILALISGLLQAAPQIIAALIQLGAQMSEALMSIDWLSLGADIIGGIATGVANGVGALIDAVKGAAKKALDSAKAALGINSPSKVFRDEVGKQIDAGIAGGIEDYTSPIKNAVSNMSGMTQNRFNAATNIGRNASAMSSSEMAIAGTGDLTIPVYIGQQKFGQAVVTANQMNKYRSGGR